MSLITISSNHQLSIIEEHFKVLAGPGAGKTYFLVNHIRNLLRNSKRLSVSKKIACITYTNVATEKILRSVGDHGGRLEISTIHSFLYKYIIKPYSFAVASTYNLAYEKVQGHDDIVMSGYSFFEEWKKSTKQNYVDHNDAIKAWNSLKWQIKPDKSLELVTPYPVKSGKYFIKKESYLEYKKMMWSEGYLHHDDVLFFSYQVLKNNPFVLEILRACFPYFLVDEFQDTSPIQIEILALLAAKETMVGVIGDEIQSIYSFLGAVPGQLHSFNLPGIKEYVIKDNWRGSNEIVALLNLIRTDITQQAKRNISVAPPTILVGEKIKCLEWVEGKYTSKVIVSLSRDNLTANSMLKRVSIAGSDLLVELGATDSNSERRKLMSNSIKAIEYAKMGYYKDAIKTINKSFGFAKTKQNQKHALKTLCKLLEKEEVFSTGKLMDLYNFINTEGLASPSKFKTGPIKTFYENADYNALTLAVRNLYEAGSHRTIHKSKGEEFECVLLILDKDEKGQFNETKELSFLLTPNLVDDEEHRILYVAISRARDHLFISVPQLSSINQGKLDSMGFRFEYVS